MKKSYLILAAAATMFAACSQDALVDESVELAQGGETAAISFGTFAGQQVKGAENSSATNTYALEAYNKSFYVWGNKNVTESSLSTPELNPSVFFKQPVNFTETPADPFDNTGDWVYSPLRFWDKSAIKYRFFAVSPVDEKWGLAASYDDATTPAVTPDPTITTLDGVTALKFKYSDYEADGKSLAQKVADGPTTNHSTIGDPTVEQPNEVFTVGKDLMISTDITNWNPVNQRVNLEFNHILSRLNIAVKEAVAKTYGKKDKEVTIGENTYTVYVYNGGTDKYVKDGGDYYLLEGTEPNYLKGTAFDTGIADYAEANWAAVQVDDETNPLSGIVKLTSLQVFNLKNQGIFNEMGFDAETDDVLTTAIDPAILSAGTDLRWKATNPNTAGFGVTFNNTDHAGTLGTEFTKNPDQATATDYVDGTVITSFTNVLNGNYNFFYQGLVVPQTINYEEINIQGTSLSSTSAPYLKISYTIDGEPFTYYYNLAQIFSNVLADYTFTVNSTEARIAKTTAEDVYAYITTNGVYSDKECTSVLTKYAYKNGDAYQAADGTPIYTDGTYWYNEAPVGGVYDPDNKIADDNIPTTFIKGAKGSQEYLTRKEAVDKNITGASSECDITFCEGWQNNLFITIKPAYILFDATVYEWVTKTEYEVNIPLN